MSQEQEEWEVLPAEEDDELEEAPPLLKRLLAADPTRNESEYWVDAEAWDLEKIKSDFTSHQRKMAASKTGLSTLADAIAPSPASSDAIVLDDDDGEPEVDDDGDSGHTKALIEALRNAGEQDSHSGRGTVGGSLFAEFSADTAALEEEVNPNQCETEVVELSDDDEEYAPPKAKAGFPLKSEPKANSSGVKWQELKPPLTNPRPSVNPKVPQPPAHRPPQALLNARAAMVTDTRTLPAGKGKSEQQVPMGIRVPKPLGAAQLAGKGRSEQQSMPALPTQKPLLGKGTLPAGKGKSKVGGKETGQMWQSKQWQSKVGGKETGKSNTAWVGSFAPKAGPTSGAAFHSSSSTSGTKRPFSAVDTTTKGLVDPEGREYDFSRVVVNLVNVGVSYGKRVEGKDPGQKNAFSWEGVRKCVKHLHNELNMLVVGIIWENFTAPGSAPDEISVPYDIRNLMETTILTPRVTGTHHKSADDEMTIKVAYRRNCRFLDNDNYRDWLVSMNQTKTGIWLQHSQELLHMRYFFDSGTGDFDTLDGNVAPQNRKRSEIQNRFAK